MNTENALLASDNASGVHPAVWEWMARANRGHALGYGADAYTRQAERAFKDHFGDDASAFMVGTGTAANVLALHALTRSVDAVFCADCAHLLVDECGAPERVLGCKLIGVETVSGKITPAALENAVAFQSGMIHRNRPRVLSISQVTEYGTLYTPAELDELARYAHANGMRVHMDGSRLANAAAALGLSLREASRDLGVDVLSFGGTKNGLMMAEAVVIFDPELADLLPFIRKQGMQLASKQRFLAAQYLAYFEEDMWLANARHANRMARRLADGLCRFEGVALSAPVEANMIFARLPPEWVQPLQSRLGFRICDPIRSEVRMVASFDITERDVDAVLAEVARCAAKENGP